MKKSNATEGHPESGASELISNRIAELADWRGKALARMRKLIHEAAPAVREEWKWMGTPVWSLDGIICTGESYKQVVKLTFAKGASLKDSEHLFNSSLDGNVRRAIDIREGEAVDPSAFKALVRQAVALNRSGKSKLVKNASSARFKSVDDYLASLESEKTKTLRSVIELILSQFPELQSKIAWNVPQIHRNGKYVFGVAAFRHHLTLAPWSPRVIEAFKARLGTFVVKKNCFQIPVDWEIDRPLLKDLVSARLAELK